MRGRSPARQVALFVFVRTVISKCSNFASSTVLSFLSIYKVYSMVALLGIDASDFHFYLLPVNWKEISSLCVRMMHSVGLPRRPRKPTKTVSRK
jgi:hypothetical protein